MLNDFVSTSRLVGLYGKLGSFGVNPSGRNSSRYDPLAHTILIHEDVLRKVEGSFQPDPYLPNSKQLYLAVSHLAHELTHALQGINEDPTGAKFANAIDYAEASCLNEGEALYYELMALDKLYGDDAEAMKTIKKTALSFAYWEDNVAVQTKQIGRYDEIALIVNDEKKTEEKKIQELAEINAKISGGALSVDNRIPFTYNELYRWYWLQKHTDFVFDFLEAFLPSEYLCYGLSAKQIEDIVNRKSKNEAIGIVNESEELAFYLKVLVNKANNYLGIKDSDTEVENLEAKENGSVLGTEVIKDGTIVLNEGGGASSGGDLGRIEYNEVLWGGKGIDNIRGSQVQNLREILLGGDGDDHLYGFGGDDLLAGNLDNDHLYGGDGNDRLLGGDGHDHLYGDGNDEASGKDEEKQVEGGNDYLVGGAGDDHLWGGKGDDYLYGDDVDGTMKVKKDEKGNNIGAGNDHLHGGSGVNYLYGGAGKDTYYIGEGIDVISDPDRAGDNASVIMWKGKKLDKIYRVSGNLYADFNGLSYYNYGSRMLVFQPGGGLIASLEGFDFLMQRSAGGSNYGLTVVDDNPINDIPKTVMPGTNPGLGGDVYHTINSSASQKGQYVGIISGSKDDLFTGGYGNEVVDMGAGNDIANGGLGHDVIDGGSQYSWAA